MDGSFVFLPLGGVGEIGMNLYLYGLGSGDDRKWLMVDLGITFPGEREPGVDVVMPDIRFIEEDRQNLCGIILTHAHEDHFGAVLDLWPRLGAPIYATSFTVGLLRAKISEYGFGHDLPLNLIEQGARFDVGPFNVELISMTHSIPQPNALAIRTRLGTALHTGDWKLDKEPLIGQVTDEARLREVGDEGVDALICDSTNVLRTGISPTEGEVGRSLTKLIGAAKCRVAVTTFASNVARIKSINEAAKATGRRLIVAGRALDRVINVAMECGLLDSSFKFHGPDEYGYLPREEVLLLCTGSQGENRAALARIAEDEHRSIHLAQGDMVIFSSRTIPGNEKTVGFVQNALAELGVTIITDADALVHVTGHPRRDELELMYRWTRPKAAVPMHGEARHLEAHQQLAKSFGVKTTIAARNGSVVRLAPAPAEIIDEAPTGRIYRDGHLFLGADASAIAERRKLSFVGIMVVSMLLTKKGDFYSEPRVMLDGIPELDAMGVAMRDEVLDSVEGAIASIPKPKRKNVDLVREAARRAARNTVYRAWGKKPLCKVMVEVIAD